MSARTRSTCRHAFRGAAWPLWSAVLSVLLTSGAGAEPSPSAPTGQQALADLLSGTSARVGLHAVRLADGKSLASHDADAPMVPASVQKICTSAVALAVLGRGFRFTTTVATLGQDVLIVGDGDPTLGDPVLAKAADRTIYAVPDQWVRALQDRGVTTIAGDLVLDETVFQAGRHEDWPVPQRSRWYCAPAGGLNFNDNCLDVLLRRHAGAVEVTIRPASRFIQVTNRLRIGNRDVWRVVYSRDDGDVTLTGQVRRSMTAPYSVAVNEPALLLGRVFADRLHRAGVPVEGSIVRRRVVAPNGALPKGAVVVATHTTPLATALARMNGRSLNLAAECVFLRTAAGPAGRATYAEAAKLATAVLVDRYGIDAGQFTIADGSGLSRNNRLSCRAATDLLLRLARGKHGQTFVGSLAVCGVDGTLAKRLKQCRGRVAAKTGSLSGVTALAGYVLDAKGTPAVAFAVFGNNIRGGKQRLKNVIDSVVKGWVDQVDQAAAGRDRPGDP